MTSHNMSWIQYPNDVSTAVEDVIASQSIIARCMHVYMALCAPVSLVTGLFNLTTFIRSRARLGALDAFLLDLTVTNVLMTFLSLTIVSRPHYLATTKLSCAVLSFLFNLCYFNTQYVQVAMLFVFLLQGSPFCLCMATKGVQRPAAGLVAIWGCALCSSLAVVALLGISKELHSTTQCQLDLLIAWPEYEIVKFSLGFGFSLVLELAFFILLVMRLAWRTTSPQRNTASAHLVVLAVALTTFACRLFYNVILLQRARLKLQRDLGSPRDELLMNLAEIVLFGESCMNSLAILLLHTPCRLALRNIPECLTQMCRRGEAGNSISLS
ncbi:uncharacterized protein LOC119241437 [Talpa occidentalis]|uniref:uncharacterized protein LOC119241437 n=1 Tax=Talpa occidentalis TaxID=50954 RepID=UPI00188F981E|nr:uncharacterized protein LOC119241437 [Talpa occidentalis]